MKLCQSVKVGQIPFQQSLPVQGIQPKVIGPVKLQMGVFNSKASAADQAGLFFLRKPFFLSKRIVPPVQNRLKAGLPDLTDPLRHRNPIPIPEKNSQLPIIHDISPFPILPIAVPL